ncbi:Pol, partial [Symbiodinium sp. CCMP2456]
RKISFKALSKVRAKQFQANPELQQGYKNGAIAKSKSHTRRAIDAQDSREGGRDLWLFTPDWKSWPSASGKQHGRQGNLWTCRRVSLRAEFRNQCKGRPGSAGKCPGAQWRLWQRLQGSPANRDKLLQIWNLHQSAADSLFVSGAPQASESRLATAGSGKTRHLPGVKTEAGSKKNEARLHGEKVLVAHVDGTCIPGVYSPPDCEEETAGLLLDSWTANQVHRSHGWVALGDFNAPPPMGAASDSPCGSFFRSWGGYAVTDGKPTRWEGTEAIDWFIAGANSALQWEGQCRHTALSDHVPVCASLVRQTPSTQAGRLKPGPKWVRPASLPQKDWESLLQKEWTALASVSGPLSDLAAALRKNSSDVQACWDLFMSALYSTFHNATRAASVSSADPVVKRECHDLLHQTGMRAEWKGKPAKHQTVSVADLSRGPPGTQEANRRLNRRLARLYELRNLTAKAVQRDEQELTPAMVALCAKLWRNRPLPDRVTQLAGLCRQEISDTKSSRESLEKSQKQKNCTEWRNQLKDPSLQGLSRWLRGKDQDPAGVVVFDDQGDALDSQEVTDKINRHWRQVWMEQRQAESPTPEAIATTLVQDFGKPVVTSWSEWSEQDLRTALAKASRSAGTDSWSAAEIRCLPPEAVHTWFLLTQQWLRCGTLPLQLRQVRMVNLVKAHKVRANRRLSVADCRPISVMSVFWRVFASAWSRKARAWMDSNLPAEVGSRAGAAGAEGLASELQDALVCDGGFLASLCYDRMQGDAATAALEQLGWPGELCRLMREAWVHDRFVSWDQHTSSDVLKASAVPQGCPLAPVTLLIWMTSGFRWTEAQLTHTGASLTRIYMDDRSWWASRWSGVEERINSWTSWSRRVGLKESTSKTQITAKGRISRTLLALNADPAWIREDAKILGCTTVTSGRRRDSETETDRLARAARRASLLRCTGLPCYQMQKAFQYFCELHCWFRPDRQASDKAGDGWPLPGLFEGYGSSASGLQSAPPQSLVRWGLALGRQGCFGALRTAVPSAPPRHCDALALQGSVLGRPPSSVAQGAGLARV